MFGRGQIRCDVLEHVALIPPAHIYILENQILSLARDKIRRPDQSARVAVGQRAEEHRIDQAEDGCVRANAKREGEDRDGGEGGRFTQHPEAVANVL